MTNTEYINTKSYLTQQILDLANTLSRIDEQLDDMYKINLYLLRRYKDDLIKEFNIDIPEGVLDDPWFKLLEKTFNQNINFENETLILSLILNRIKDKMKEEMPDPWYCYGFGVAENKNMAQLNKLI